MKRPERRRLREKKEKEKELSCLRCNNPKGRCDCVHPIPSGDGNSSNGDDLDQVLKMEYPSAISHITRRIQ